MTLRTEGLWEGSVQRSDVPELLAGARMGRWMMLAWSGCSGEEGVGGEERLWCSEWTLDERMWV